MASNATIYKALLQIADMDRQHFQDHALTLARHPSETEERMMVRVLAFALHADEALSFGRGVGTEDEPALWQRDFTGAIDRWIEIGQPDEKTLRQACGRSKQVIVLCLWSPQRRSLVGKPRPVARPAEEPHGNAAPHGKRSCPGCDDKTYHAVRMENPGRAYLDCRWCANPPP